MERPLPKHLTIPDIRSATFLVLLSTTVVLAGLVGAAETKVTEKVKKKRRATVKVEKERDIVTN